MSQTSSSSIKLPNLSDFQAFMSGVFVIYQVTLLYLADWYASRHICAVNFFTGDIPSYGPYTSSAQAGLSLARGSAFSTYYCAGLKYERQYNGPDRPAGHTADVR
jgi:hypothetical protein